MNLFHVSTLNLPLYTYYVNFLVGQALPLDISHQQKKRFLMDVNPYYWMTHISSRNAVSDQLIRRCVPKEETQDILHHCHSLIMVVIWVDKELQ